MSSGNTTLLQRDFLTSTVVSYKTVLKVISALAKPVATSSSPASRKSVQFHTPTVNQLISTSKSPRPIYGSLVERLRLESIFFNDHNIIMLVEMLATGLPFVGWKVKPDPGD